MAALGIGIDRADGPSTVATVTEEATVLEAGINSPGLRQLGARCPRSASGGHCSGSPTGIP
jgi:hypothetical protein